MYHAEVRVVYLSTFYGLGVTSFTLTIAFTLTRTLRHGGHSALAVEACFGAVLAALPCPPCPPWPGDVSLDVP